MSKQEARIGVFVCHCGKNIAGKVHIDEVVDYAKKLPNVVIAQPNQFMCSTPGQNMIKNAVKEHKLNRVVVASCSPTMHESTFQTTTEEAGLNKYQFQMANIREFASWVTEDPKEATKKAKRLVGGAVSRVAFHEPLIETETPVNPATLIVGGGIAGISAALKIANAGYKVYLLEKEPTIGGKMAMFDKTFPTLDCAACILTPKMNDVGKNENIELLTWSELQKVDGHAGDFQVQIKKKARYVDLETCISCGQCEEKCPTKIDSEFELGMAKRKAIFRYYPQQVPSVPTIDSENCLYLTKGRCGICAKVCPVEAINYEDQDETIEINVGNIIVSTGFDIFDAERLPQYGYGNYDNVITSLEFERLSNAAGPTEGKLLKKDGKPIESAAIIHCIGSRDVNTNIHCSRVCCMNALKVSSLIRDKLPNSHVYEFYIDIRAAGKGYEEFYHRMLRSDIRLIRGKVSEVTNIPDTPEDKGKLTVIAEDTLLGEIIRVPVDMVVLMVGLEPRHDSKELAQILHLSCTEEGFYLERHPKLAPTATAIDGIYVAGACQYPKDVPDSVAQGESAAAAVLSSIQKGKLKIEPTTAEIDEDLCSGCRNCVKLCPYSAIDFDEEKNIAIIESALCQGCGVCVASCPSGAIEHKGYTDKQIFAEIEGILAKGD